MIISLNWIKEYTDIDMPIGELSALIGARLVEIEAVENLGQKYKDVVVARVVECHDLEGSDHLRVAKLDDNKVVDDVERDENGYVQVVCGAPNVRAGILVAWLPPRSVVPNTFASEDPFVLDARKLRGVVSNGMIASPRELDLYDEHDGILELDVDALAGTAFSDVYGTNDYLLDIENKSLTHRPDAFGIIGFAREIAAIQGKKFNSPEWFLKPVEQSISEDLTEQISVAIDVPEYSRRYQAVVIGDISGEQSSPLGVQSKLTRLGLRPIRAVVDVTNYLMMLTGQPLHAFDYDKLKQLNNGQVDIRVRGGRAGETLELLDGKTIELSHEDIVIANGNVAVALAGAMGGKATEIDATTKTVVLESATFNLYNLRTTQMRHGIYSEAITRFTKGQPAELTAPVLLEALRMLAESGARQLSPIAEASSETDTQVPIETSSEFINGLLGSKFSADDIVTILENAEFEVTFEDQIIHVTAPFWRADIHIAEDIAEEVGRLSGFDSIELALPTRDFEAIRPSGFDELRSRLRDTLQIAGGNEVLSYSFIHGNVITKAHQRTENSYRIVNSISPDLQYYRQTLTPSLLGLIHPNIKQGFNEFALFELNKVHPKDEGLTEEGVPRELDMLSFVSANKKNQPGAAYYQAKKTLDYVAQSLGLELSNVSIEAETNNCLTAPFEYRRSAQVTNKSTGQVLGVVGEYKDTVKKNFKLPEYIAGFEINTKSLYEATQSVGTSYTPLSRFPSTERDVCFQVNREVTYQAVVQEVQKALVGVQLATAVSALDIYQPENGTTKNITLRIRLTPLQQTLTGEETSRVIDQVVASVCTQLAAVHI